MTIDIKALKRMSQGDPKSKVLVSRKWLAEVHRMLTENRPVSLMEEIFGSKWR